MTRVRLKSKTGPDGVLHLAVPLGEPETAYDVEVVAYPKRGRVLPEGYFDLYGSVDDETFTVHPQPPMPPPVDIE